MSSSAVFVMFGPAAMIGPTAVMAASADSAIIAPMSLAVVDHRRRGISPRRFVDHRRRRSPPKRVDVDDDASAGVGGGSRDQERCRAG